MVQLKCRDSIQVKDLKIKNIYILIISSLFTMSDTIIWLCLMITRCLGILV